MLKAINRIEKQVAFAEMMTNRAWMINAFAIRRNERVKGRTRIDEVMVWESFRLRILNNSDDGGKPAAKNRACSLL
ncbi:hypothetical protein AgCh_015909 [Apium graveolens]